MNYWSLQEAKNKFSQVIDVAMSEHRPQIITRRGKNTAVVMGYEDFLKLSQGGKSLLERLVPDEPIDFELEIHRQQDFGRETAFPPPDAPSEGHSP